MKPLIGCSLRFSGAVLGIGLFLVGCSKEKSNPVIPPPSAPSNLTISVLSPTSVRLSWRDNSLNEIGFEIERAVEQEEFQVLIRLGSDVNRWTDTTLAEGTLARYRVVAISRSSRSNPSNEAQAATPLFAPSQLTAQKISSRQINLSWQDNSQKETGYQIQRRQSGRSWVLIATTAPNTTEYSDTNLVEENIWDYRVRAVRDTIISDWSNVVRADTDVPTPAAPTNLEARPVSQMSVALQWVDNSLDELGFVIEVSRSPESGFQPRDSTREDVTSTIVGGLSSQTTYYFRVYAYNDSGNSPYSNIASATTPAGAPLPPSDLTGTAPTYRAVILTWRDNSDNEESFHIERKLTIANIWSPLVELTANTTSYSDSDVVPGASYNYRVYARNGMGSSPYSNEIRVVVPSGSPNPPSNLDAVPIHHRLVEITWRDNSDDELGFTIQRRLVGTSTWTTLGDVGANVTQYNDETVSPLTSYGYRVQAFNRIGDRLLRSEWSNEDTVTTPNGPPNAPSNLIATGIAIDRIRLQWRDNSNNETDFIVERRGPGEPNFSPIATTPANRTVYTDSALAYTTWYAYRVKAINEMGESGYSNIDSARTLNPVVFYDGFESYNVGDPPRGGGWQDTARGTSWIRVTDQISNPPGGKSCQFHDPDVGNNFCALDLRAPAMTQGKLSLNIYLAGVGSFGIWGGDNQNYITFDIRFRSDGNIYARSGASFMSLGAYQTNRWLAITISFDMQSHTYQLYIDGRAVGDRLQTQRTDHLDNRFVRMIGFIDATIQDVFVDEFSLDLRVAEALQSFSPVPYAGEGDQKIDRIDRNDW